MRKGLILIAGFMTANAAHAEDAPTNAELFRMLKAQQQTISELRAELKQAKQERIAASPSQRRQPGMADGQKGRDAAREAMAADLPTQAIYKAPPALTPADRGAYVGLFGGGAFGGDSNVNQLGTVFLYEFQGGAAACQRHGANQQQQRRVRRRADWS